MNLKLTELDSQSVVIVSGRFVEIQALYVRTSTRDRSTCELIFRILELIVQWETFSIAQSAKDISIARMHVSYIRIWITLTLSMRLHLLVLSFTPDIKCNLYIQTIVEENEKNKTKKNGWFILLLTPFMFCVYKNKIRPKIKYRRHIWAGTAQFSLSSFDWFQNRIRLVQK